MSTPEKWLDAEGLRYALHGEDNESVLDSDSGIIINAGHQEDAELLRDQLNSYESRLAEQKAAALSLRDELAKERERVAHIRREWEADAKRMNDELAECRAKLAAQIERCGFAELAETQRALERDNALAKLAQAESETARVRAMLDEDEALRDAVRENLPECTCDADGNLGGEVDRVEFAGEELRRALAKLAQAEQERNRYAAQTVTLGVAHQMAETDLAAAQAENAELRNVVAASEAEWRKLSGPASAWSDGDARRDAAKDIADDHARVLARPADVAALRVMLLEWAGGVWALAAPDREMDANTITAELDRRLRGGK